MKDEYIVRFEVDNFDPSRTGAVANYFEEEGHDSLEHYMAADNVFIVRVEINISKEYIKAWCQQTAARILGIGGTFHEVRVRYVCLEDLPIRVHIRTPRGIVARCECVGQCEHHGLLACDEAAKVISINNNLLCNKCSGKQCFPIVRK